MESREIFSCGKCPRTFRSKGTYNQHLKTHSKPYRCSQCERGFALRSDLSRHSQARHRVGQSKHACSLPECTFRATRKDNLRQHVISHHGQTAVQPAVPKETLEQEGKHREEGDPPDSTFERPVHTIKAVINYPSILEAATVGNLEMLQNLVRIGASISTQGDDGSTALHCAARAGHAEVVEYILNKGLDRNVKNEKGRTALDEAAIGGDMTTLEVLLNARVKVDMDDRRAKETIRRILRLRDAQLMKVLLDKLRIGNDAKKAMQLLLNATVAGPITLVRYLLSYPGLAGSPRLKEGIFRRAANYGWEDVIDFLLAHGNFNINASNGYYTALHLAAEFNHVGVVRRLLGQSKCSINKMVFGDTALCHAAGNGHEEVVKLLLGHELVDVNLKGQFSSRTPLMYASAGGHARIVKLLLGYKNIQVNIVNYWGESAMHEACEKGHMEVVKALLDHGGIDINLRATRDYYSGERNRTALDFARERGYTEIVNLLLEHGAEDSANIQNTPTPTDANSEVERITLPSISNYMLNGQLDLYNPYSPNRPKDSMEMSIRDPETQLNSSLDEEIVDMLWDDAKWEKFISEHEEMDSS